ncbi:MAG: hypothetical protein WCJ35_12755 [Planctomycetota bacterium]
MIAPASPRRVTLDPVVCYRVAIDAEPSNCIPALAAVLISQWREKKAEDRAAAEAAGKTQEPHP